MRKSVKKGVRKYAKKSIRKQVVEQEEPEGVIPFDLDRRIEWLVDKKGMDALFGKPERPPLPETPEDKKKRQEPEPEYKIKIPEAAPRPTNYMLYAVLFLVVFAIAALLIFTVIGLPTGCSDGTLFSQCSETKPLYCSRGEDLILNPQKCGCPDGEMYYDGGCIITIECEDGTLAPECSENQPLRCIYGRLMSDAQACGCPEGYAEKDSGCITLEEWLESL